MSRVFRGMERIEEAREPMTNLSFMAGVFGGNPQFELLLPLPESHEEKQAGDHYCQKIDSFLQRHVDPEAIERTAKIPDDVLRGLFDLGAFGMKIPKAYGGLGFSYTNYGRVLTLIASWSNVLSLTVAVPQSIGIAMPILQFGNEDQKKKYLPRVAKNEISAFALTEPMTGSDAANIQTEAVLDSSGTHFVVNGEKLWCTNGPIASLVTLIAKVPSKRVHRDGQSEWVPVPSGNIAENLVHTAFILDMNTPGVMVRQRCQFKGCRGLENAHILLNEVRIPIENVIGQIGQGLKYALTILNVGRAVSIPAICLGMAKQAWQPTLDRANSRYTFQKALATRQTQIVRAGHMAADLFAMESLASLVWHMADQKKYDIRIEAAIAKICCSEKTIQFLKNAQIIFGGMGYETAASKSVRGEPTFPIEQLVRDVEMYRIGEGATDIMRPFVAREAFNPYLERAKAYLDQRSNTKDRTRELFKLVRWYVPQYWKQWKRNPLPLRREMQHPQVRKHMVYVERACRRLTRAIMYILVFHREALRDDQGRQNRIEMVGEDILTICATALYAESLEQAEGDARIWDLAEEVFREATKRIDDMIPEIIHNDDKVTAIVGRRALRNGYPWLHRGIIRRGLFDYVAKEDMGSSNIEGENVRSCDSYSSKEDGVGWASET